MHRTGVQKLTDCKGTVQAPRRPGGATAQEGVLRAARESRRSRQPRDEVSEDEANEVLI